MQRKLTAPAVIFVLLFSLSGCIEPAYIQRTDTPPNLEGFLGFRWDTPMSILDDHLMQTMDVIPCEHYYDFYSLAYENFYFLDKKAYQCKFIFSVGFSEAKLIFLPNPQYTYSDLDYFLERLTEIYGNPEQVILPDFKNPSCIEGYFWFDGRLSLTLLPGDEIIIDASAYTSYGLPHQEVYVSSGILDDYK
ncbi:MAG: hypothetical protein ACM3P0_11580 [Acidobacteriota bacterium]